MSDHHADVGDAKETYDGLSPLSRSERNPQSPVGEVQGLRQVLTTVNVILSVKHGDVMK